MHSCGLHPVSGSLVLLTVQSCFRVVRDWTSLLDQVMKRLSEVVCHRIDSFIMVAERTRSAN